MADLDLLQVAPGLLTGGANAATTFTSATVTGNSIVAGFIFQSVNVLTDVVLSDSAGNTYPPFAQMQIATSINPGSGWHFCAGIAHAQNITGHAANQLSVVGTAVNPVDATILGLELEGNLDKDTSSGDFSASSATPDSGPTALRTAADARIIGVAGTIGSRVWTPGQTPLVYTMHSNLSNQRVMESTRVTAVGTEGANYTIHQAAEWAAVCLALVVSGGAGPTFKPHFATAGKRVTP